MDLARVVGSIVSTRKYESLIGCKLCVIQPIDHHGQNVGEPQIAIDPDSRVDDGEIVFFVTSGDAAILEEGKGMPVDASIVGIVDVARGNDVHVQNVGSLRTYKKY